jgi:hypothetical protein
VKDAVLDMFYGILLAPSSELYPIGLLPEIPLTYARHSPHQLVGPIEEIVDEESRFTEDQIIRANTWSADRG